MPTRHRDVLGATASGQLTITRHPHGCLMIFPRPEWEQFRARIAALPMDAQWWKRIFLGNAMDVELDSTGRVLGFDFTKTKDGGYDKKLREIFATVKFRPGTGPDGSPIRAKGSLAFQLY